MGMTWRQNSNHYSGRVPRLHDQRRGARCEAKQSSCYLRFLILRVSYTTSTLPTGKQLKRNSTWRSCDVCVNQFAENTGKLAGWRLDPAPRQCARTHFTSCAAIFGQTRHGSVAPAAILIRSRTVRLKKVLKGPRFEAKEDIKRNSTKTLLDIPKEEFANCFQQWQKCWAKRVAAEGNYVEDS